MNKGIFYYFFWGGILIRGGMKGSQFASYGIAFPFSLGINTCSKRNYWVVLL